MIALYGGSFDPVHLGHLRIAEDIREIFGFSKIIFIPAYISPFKSGSYANAEDRLKMLQIATEGNKYFEVCDFEIKKGGKSYTIDTIQHFSNKTNSELFFILGSDTFLSFHKWKNPDKILEKSNLIVVGRNQDLYKDIVNYTKRYFPDIKVKDKYSKGNNSRIYFYGKRRIDVSSTEIRNRIKNNKSIKYLVPEDVEKFILEKKLYRG